MNVTAYFGGAVLLSSSSASYINFQNVNSFVLGNTSNTSLASASDVSYSGSSSSGMHMEVAGTLINDGTWKGNVYVGKSLANSGTIQGDVQTVSGCTGSCTSYSSSVTGNVTTSPYNPAVYVFGVRQYFTCLSSSLGSRTQTPTAVSYSPSVNPITAAIALSSGISNYVNVNFTGIQVVTLGGGDSRSLVFINVVDNTQSLAFPQTWQIPSYIKNSSVIVNVLYATNLSGSFYSTPIIAPNATLVATSGQSVTATYTMVVNTLSTGGTFYFTPNTTIFSADTIPNCYQG
jgi:hypothetical protein